MKIKAGKDTVICTNPPEQKTKGGLTLTGENNKKPELGIVYDIGSPRKDSELPLNIAVGDTIVFRKYADNRIFIAGKEYNFIRYEDVVGVIEHD